MKKRVILLLILFFLCGSFLFDAKKTCPPSKITQVVFLGTGTPNPDPEHSGISVAIVVNDTPYIVDFGPGLIRKAAELSPDYGGKMKGMSISNFKRAFVTHLHSDHTTGYPDLIFTPWVGGRDEPLKVYGPVGIKSMTKHILEAYREDIRIRVDGPEPINNQGWRVHAHEIKAGIVYTDKNVRVEAFRVVHGNFTHAFGFKFTTPDRTIAISGDTRPCENLIKKCKGVDILIHEVYSYEKWKARSKFWQKYHSLFHTSTLELADIANRVKPGCLILYHQLFWGATDKDLLKEIKKRYKGKVISARDLDVF